MNPDVRAALWGAATFAVAALLLKPLWILGIGLPAAGLAFVGAAALQAGVCEELARAGALQARARRGAAGARQALAFAIGYAALEAVLAGVLVPLQWLALTREPEALAALPPAARAAAERQLAALSAFTPLWLLIERAAAAVAQLGLGWLVWRAVSDRRWTGVVLAIALHALIDVPAAGFQAGWWPLWAAELVYLAAAALAAPWVIGAWRRALRAAPARATTSG